MTISDVFHFPLGRGIIGWNVVFTFITLLRFNIFSNCWVRINYSFRPYFGQGCPGMFKIFQLQFLVGGFAFFIQVSSKMVMRKGKSSQISAKWGHPSFDTIECTSTRGISCKKQGIQIVFLEMLNCARNSFFISTRKRNNVVLFIQASYLMQLEKSSLEMIPVQKYWWIDKIKNQVWKLGFILGFNQL